MKIRNGFVSNSSSSSFVIEKKYLTKIQMLLIRNHFDIGKMLDNQTEDYIEGEFFEEGYEPDIFIYLDGCQDAWDIGEDDLTIEGSTWMDNFSMRKFMRLIDVDCENVKWTDG
ncbi:hypothetical protein LCGC14_2300100 [marine sediment metagenome]|uniref:Uncharacterized protein n=1 Tax=marine sediment metagenome TaxID=412755 RepID=A0A0F9FIN3_9ZZZZ